MLTRDYSFREDCLWAVTKAVSTFAAASGVAKRHSLLLQYAHLKNTLSQVKYGLVTAVLIVIVYIRN